MAACRFKDSHLSALMQPALALFTLSSCAGTDPCHPGRRALLSLLEAISSAFQLSGPGSSEAEGCPPPPCPASLLAIPSSWRREHLTASRPSPPASGHCCPTCVHAGGPCAPPEPVCRASSLTITRLDSGDHLHTLPVKSPHFWALPAAPAAAVATDAWSELPLPAAQSSRFVTPLKKMLQGSAQGSGHVAHPPLGLFLRKSWSHISMY